MRVAIKCTVLAATSVLSTLLSSLLFVMFFGGLGRGDILSINVDLLINSVAVVLVQGRLDCVYMRMCGCVDKCCHNMIVPRIEQQMGVSSVHLRTSPESPTVSVNKLGSGNVKDDTVNSSS